MLGQLAANYHFFCIVQTLADAPDEAGGDGAFAESADAPEDDHLVFEQAAEAALEGAAAADELGGACYPLFPEFKSRFGLDGLGFGAALGAGRGDERAEWRRVPVELQQVPIGESPGSVIGGLGEEFERTGEALFEGKAGGEAAVDFLGGVGGR